MKNFIIWEPYLRRLRLVKTDSETSVKLLREAFRLPPSIGQIWAVSERKYNYIKGILQDERLNEKGL